MNPLAYNEDGGAEARGIFQITRRFHPEVSDAEAYDPEWATDWALKQPLRIWSCSKKIGLSTASSMQPLGSLVK